LNPDNEPAGNGGFFVGGGLLFGLARIPKNSLIAALVAIAALFE